MRIVVINSLTLDGVAQAPGRPDEDRRGGFQHGGWGQAYADEVVGKAMGARMARPASEGGLLLGRVTYEDFFAVWPKRRDGNPYTERLNKAQRYVVSRTLKEPLPWQNSVLLAGDAAESVARLKKDEPDKDLCVLGSIRVLLMTPACGSRASRVPSSPRATIASVAVHELVGQEVRE
jgi:dihydrofolate reductase